MATIVYLVRHAEAEGNVYRRCHGQYDSLLTTHGEQQLPYLAKRFADIPLDAVYASDLYRARKTAQAIADTHGFSVQVRPILKEINMGEWEDKTWAELPREYPDAYAAWLHRPWDALPPKGETLMQAGARMLGGLREIAKENPDRTIAVVSHGSAIRGAICILLGYPPERIVEIPWGDNTCVSKLVFTEDGKVTIAYRNDVSHLPEEMQTFYAIGWKDTRAMPTSQQLWFRPVCLQNTQDVDNLLRLAAQGYEDAYGDAQKLNKQEYLKQTKQMLGADSMAVTFGMVEETPAALIRLNVCDTTQADTGMIDGFILDAAYRGKGFSQQMLGQAISFYRARGKQRICALAAEKDTEARKFYDKFGFVREGNVQNENGLHDRMVKEIEVPPYLAPQAAAVK